MKKRVFYREIAYIFAIIFVAFGAAFTELANFGMSMVVAPAYILHLKLVEFLPWFTFGVAEYTVCTVLLVLMIIVIRKFKVSYLFSFITAILYGTCLDGAIFLLSFLPSDLLALRIVWFIIGTVICATGVSFYFHTYISPPPYELIVKEISGEFKLDINKTKITYDVSSTVVAIALSFIFFGLFNFRGIGIGTVILAVINGLLIGTISKIFERFFEFKDKFNFAKYF